MSLRIVKSHSREHKAKPAGSRINLNDVLTFINRASSNELLAMRIAMQQRPSWVRAGKGVNCGN